MKLFAHRAALLTPFLVFWLGFFIAPVLLIFRVSLFEGGGSSGFGIGAAGGYYVPGTWTLAALRYAFLDQTNQTIVFFNLWYGALVALLSLGLGVLLAIGLCEMGGKSRRWALATVVLTKFANLLVIIYGLKWILSNAGPINNALLDLKWIEEPVDLLNGLFSAVLGETYLIIPYVALVMSSKMLKIDRHIILTARSLGLNPWQVYLKAILPMSFDSLKICFFISLVWGMGAYVSPLFLGSPDQWTLSIEIQRQVFENINWPRGAALSLLLFTIFLGTCLVLISLARGIKRWL